jgi:AcrR family transcriptional regulator
MRAPTDAGGAGPPAPLSAAKSRIVAAALQLFARNGVGGTSLQMIADEIGVTKAAVYHQFHTKDEIILAAAESELTRVVEVLDAAEAEPTAARARRALVAGMVDLAIERRHTTGAILSDPVIVGFFTEQEAFHDVMHRLRLVLVGDDRSPEARVRTAMLVAAISGTVMHPFVVDLDDDLLRDQLLDLARTYLRAR